MLYSETMAQGGLRDLPTQFEADHEGVYKVRPKEEGRRTGINTEGFRGIEFQPSAQGAKVLFLGDSFTWGYRAAPIEESFVDQVGHAGYAAFNAGIPATGPTQYAFLAEKWVPRLKPAVVAVMFSMGTDIGPADPMLPGKPPQHMTTLGSIRAFDGAIWLGTPEEAFRHWAEGVNVFSRPPMSRLRRLVGLSAVGTRLWALNYKPQMVYPPGKVTPEMVTYTRECLRRIREVSNQNGARFLLFIIPTLRGQNRSPEFVGAQAAVFEGFEPLAPTTLTAADFPPDNAHFNNEGHRKYAAFILAELAKAGVPPN